jgi:hypothetical protein
VLHFVAISHVVAVRRLDEALGLDAGLFDRRRAARR